MWWAPDGPTPAWVQLQVTRLILGYMQKFFVVSLLVVLAGIFPCVAKEHLPLKVIAPDLIIETAEQGEFTKVNEKTQRADPLSFRPARIVPHKNRELFGWRIKVKTTRPSILVQEHSVDGKGKQGVPTRLVPEHGYIFRGTDYVETIPAGKCSYVIYVEKQPVVTFSFEIK